MSGTADLYRSLLACQEAGETPAVATIIHVRGSSPREVGAKMLVRPGGATDGTVGGGCGEADVWRAALDVMVDLEPRTVIVDLTQDIAMDTDGVCGGIMEIFVEPWTPESEIPRRLLESMDAKQTAIVATIVDQPGAGAAEGTRVLIVDGQIVAGDPLDEATARSILAEAPAVVEQRHSGTRTLDIGVDGTTRCTAYFELCLPKPVLVVVGAGHVAVPIAQVGQLMDFDVVVIDDRPLFANAERFPGVSRIIVDDFDTALDSVPITPSTYVVLVTRGHAHDVRCLRRIIEKPAGYIGMIGSRRRVYAVFKLLHDEGVPLDSLLRVRAPIGLDIKTETPGEIALSVGAELVKVRRGGGAASFSDLLRDQYRASLLRGAREPSTAV